MDNLNRSLPCISEFIFKTIPVSQQMHKNTYFLKTFNNNSKYHVITFLYLFLVLERHAEILKLKGNENRQLCYESKFLISNLDCIKVFSFSATLKTKKYFCVFCKKQIAKFARHLENIHRTEEEVYRFIHLPKGKPNVIYQIILVQSYYLLETFNCNLRLE